MSPLLADTGWSEPDEGRWDGMSSGLLVAATSLYFGYTALLGALSLPWYMASRRGRELGSRADRGILSPAGPAAPAR